MRPLQAPAKTSEQAKLLELGQATDSGVQNGALVTSDFDKDGSHRIAPLLGQLPDHPRLFATKAEWKRVARNLSNPQEPDPVHQAVQAKLFSLAQTILESPPLEHHMEGIRLLTVSREALRRVSALAALARLEDNTQFAQRAMVELESIARFPDWNHINFLDTAEMTLAVAIGYDWLYDHLSNTQRELIEQALLEKSILPSFDDSPANWWMQVNTNWNQVCHGGLVVAAIAIGDRYPAVAERVVQRALECLPHCVESYAPDGAYTEGLSYWNFGTAYHAIMADALLKATGTTCGVDQFPGFKQSCLYSQHATGPTGLAFNYGDCREVQGLLLPLFWLARQAGRPEWAKAETSAFDKIIDRRVEGVSRLLPLMFFWYPTDGQGSLPSLGTCQPNKSWLGRGLNPIAAFRTTWGDSKALFAAIKAGSPSTNHAHMDVGSFVLDADGVRWAIDLGMGDYHSFEEQGFALWDQSQDGDRWSAFRFGPASHNIMRHGNGNQCVDEHASFLRFQDEGSFPCAILDLSSIYRHTCREAKRGLMLLDNQAVLLQDEWQSSESSAPSSWQMLTDADVTPLTSGWMLRKDGEQLEVRLLEGTDAELLCDEGDTLLHPVEKLDRPVRRLSVHLSTKPTNCLRVVFLPGSVTQPPLPSFVPLSKWNAKAVDST